MKKSKKVVSKKPSRRDYLRSLTLADEPSEVCQLMSDYTFLIYGPPKIGKTSLVNQFPDVHHFMCEDGAKALEARFRPIHAWDELQHYIQLVRNQPNHAIKTISMDVVEGAYRLCFDAVCRRLDIDHPQDAPYGKGWNAVNNEFMDCMVDAGTIPGVGAIYVAHATGTARKTFEGDEVVDTHPALSGKILDILTGKMDVIAYYHYSGKQRYLQIRGGEGIMCGCRLKKRFLWPDGEPIDRIPMGNSDEEAYENLVAAFNNELPKPEPKVKKKILLTKKK